MGLRVPMQQEQRRPLAADGGMDRYAVWRGNIVFLEVSEKAGFQLRASCIGGDKFRGGI